MTVLPKQLNEEQLSAVTHGDGPLLIIAGAGTGKTTVVTERILWLIEKEKVKPAEILALTFTEKASREMEERVDIALPYGYTQLWISTFHSFADRILRHEAMHIGLDPGFRLMTEAESIIFFKNQLFSLDLKYFRPLGNPTKFISAMLNHFSRLKDEDVSPSEYLKWAQKQRAPARNASQSDAGGKSKEQNKSEDDSDHEKLETEKFLELGHAYQKYEELKEKEGVEDYANLISHLLRLFRERPNILKSYRSQFKHILVDEFQDTNYAQYALIKLLAPPNKNPNLTVVGDDNQSIYRFRGAAISNILMFMEDYKNAKTVVLTQNYRSTQEILDRSYNLIKFNDPDTLEAKLGIDKRLVNTRRDQDDKPIEFIYCERVEDEAETVVKKIKDQKTKIKNHEDNTNYSWKDFAILVRANSHTEPFVKALARAGIPYQFLGPGMLFRQEEIKDLIAYLHVLADFADSISFYRVLAMDMFGIEPRDIAALASFTKKTKLSLFEAAEVVASSFDPIIPREDKEKFASLIPFVSQQGKSSLVKLIQMIHRHLKLIPRETAGQILYFFLEDTGLLAKFAHIQTAHEEEQAVNIAKFFNKLKTFEVEKENASVDAVMDWIEMSMRLGESPLAADTDWTEVDAVNILTTHSAKGLEFPIVFLVNLVEGRFPTRERREALPIPDELIKEILPAGDFHLEEERRLFYVGMTRARDQLFISASNYYGEGKRERKLSPFVVEALGEKALRQIQPDKNDSGQMFLFEWKKQPEKLITEPVKQRTINYLSYSQIETFKFCPLHYKARYILRLPTPTYAAASFGQTIHATLKHFYLGLMQGENWDLAQLLTIYQKMWIPVGFESLAHEEALEKTGLKQLENFYQNFHQKHPLPKAVEQPFIFPLTPTLKIGGVMDRISRENNHIEIIDYKTSEKVPTQKEVDKNTQLTLYALAATQIKDPLFSQNPVDIRLTLYFLGAGQSLTTTRTQAQLQQAKTEILDIAHQIETSNFACSGTEWCRTCEFKMLCNPSI